MILKQKYSEVRQYSEYLCEPLCVEDYIPQSVYYTSPPKWHLAHVTWFFEIFILAQYCDDYECYDSRYQSLFNSYYQGVGVPAPRHQRGLITRPTVKEVYAYRHYVDQQMLLLLSHEVSAELASLVVVGLNHEQQHQELLLTDLKYTFFHNPTHPVYRTNVNFVASIKSQTHAAQNWLEVPKGLYSIGHEGDDFCYDNEKSRHQVFVEDFKIATSLVTNKQYLSFIEEGGYEKCRYWLDDGWRWLIQNKIKAPLYWHQEDSVWHNYTLSGSRAVHMDAPVSHLSYYEAAAFASFKQMRLPTEFEWEIAAPSLSWGERWEWTHSAYQAYPRFQIAEGALGEYNGKFMVNQMVLRGASVATSPGHSRHTYRNFFSPELRWQFTGIRLAR